MIFCFFPCLFENVWENEADESSKMRIGFGTKFIIQPYRDATDPMPHLSRYNQHHEDSIQYIQKEFHRRFDLPQSQPLPPERLNSLLIHNAPATQNIKVQFRPVNHVSRPNYYDAWIEWPRDARHYFVGDIGSPETAQSAFDKIDQLVANELIYRNRLPQIREGQRARLSLPA